MQTKKKHRGRFRHRLSKTILVTSVACLFGSPALAWDHPGHMTTAAIAYQEVMKQRPELMEKIGMLFLAHSESSPFWVAAGAARAQESYQIATEFVYVGVETRPDPDLGQDTARLVRT
jgi:hypothetical protein